MQNLDARRVAAWIREVNNVIQNDEVLTHLIRMSLEHGFLRGDLSANLIGKFPQYKDILVEKNLIFP